MRLGVRELLWQPSRFGVLVGLAALLSSFGPALIPRGWLVQAVVGGVTGSLGYAIGAVLARFVPWLLGRLGVRVVVAPTTAVWARRIVVLGAIVAVPVAWWVTLRWHRWTAEMVGMPPNTAREHAKSMALAVVLAVLFVLAGRGLVALVVLLGRWLDRVLPRVVAYVLAFVLVVGLLVWGTNSVLWRGTLEAFARSGAALNDTTPEGLVAPTSPFRSGSPTATQSWDQLGHFGRQFVSRGPSAADITAATGVPAVDPVRVYAGLDDTDGLDDALDIVATEMERTGALDRDVVVLITTTGNGWIDEYNVAAIEYLTGGDSATIGCSTPTCPAPWPSWPTGTPRSASVVNC
nr:alpha/beta-hydrolase N-terminal domain-containing protein [Kribbia dieselivorans]